MMISNSSGSNNTNTNANTNDLTVMNPFPPRSSSQTSRSNGVSASTSTSPITTRSSSYSIGGGNDNDDEEAVVEIIEEDDEEETMVVAAGGRPHPHPKPSRLPPSMSHGNTTTSHEEEEGEGQNGGFNNNSSNTETGNDDYGFQTSTNGCWNNRWTWTWIGICLLVVSVIAISVGLTADPVVSTQATTSSSPSTDTEEDNKIQFESFEEYYNYLLQQVLAPKLGISAFRDSSRRPYFEEALEFMAFEDFQQAAAFADNDNDNNDNNNKFVVVVEPIDVWQRFCLLTIWYATNGPTSWIPSTTSPISSSPSSAGGAEEEIKTTDIDWGTPGVHECSWSGIECTEDLEEDGKLVLTSINIRNRGLINTVIGGSGGGGGGGGSSSGSRSATGLEDPGIILALRQSHIPTTLEHFDVSNNRRLGGSKFLQTWFDYSYNNNKDEDGNTGDGDGDDKDPDDSVNSVLQWPRLKSIDVSKCALEGRLPSRLAESCPSLQEFAANDNSLTGPLPQTLPLQTLESFSVEFNLLSGGGSNSSSETDGDEKDVRRSIIPPSWWSIKNHIDDASNNTTSTGTDDSHDDDDDDYYNYALKNIELSMNRNLGGTLPSQLGLLTHLTSLGCSRCGLEGTLPSEIGNLSQLQAISLASNQLSGSIPFKEILNFQELEWFVVNSNQFTGTIPDGNDDDDDDPQPIFNAPKIAVLSVSQNNLNGTIPSSLGMLTSLEWIQLPDNQFTGSIPFQSLNVETTMTNLQVFWVFGNRDLEGSMPCPSVAAADAGGDHPSSTAGPDGTHDDGPYSDSDLDFRANCDIECPCCVECFTT